MPLRVRNVRVAVREAKTEQDPEWGTVKETTELVAFLKVDLVPLTGEQIARFSGAGFDANWRAIIHNPYPEVKDGFFIVTLDRKGNDKMLLRVTKAIQRGRLQDLALKEVGADQPSPPPAP